MWHDRLILFAVAVPLFLCMQGMRFCDWRYDYEERLNGSDD